MDNTLSELLTCVPPTDMLAWRRHQHQQRLKTVIFRALCVRHMVGLDLSREQPLGPSGVEACVVKSLESVENPGLKKKPR